MIPDSIARTNRSKFKKRAVVGGCILLPIILLAAIIIPTQLASRDVVRDHYTYLRMKEQLIELAVRTHEQTQIDQPTEDIAQYLRRYLHGSSLSNPNVMNSAIPAFSDDLQIVSNKTIDQISSIAQSHATVLGQSNFVIQFPAPGIDGNIAGSCKLKRSRYTRPQVPVELYPLKDSGSLANRRSITQLNPPKGM